MAASLGAQQLTRSGAAHQRQRTCLRPVPRVLVPGRALVQHQLQSACAASKLEDVPLFSDSSSLLGGAPKTSSTSAAAAQKAGPTKVEDVPLNSELGLDYSTLRDYLAAGDVRKADDETRAMLIKMAGTGAVQRGWVYFTEIPSIPAADLQTVDQLWRAASGNRFGYSVQKEMWVQAGKRWPKFFKAINWVQGENNVYLKWPAEFIYTYEAPKGHMPLTNALRGTQLFQAIMEHPAFAKGVGGTAGMSIDERSKLSGKDTLKF